MGTNEGSYVFGVPLEVVQNFRKLSCDRRRGRKIAELEAVPIEFTLRSLERNGISVLIKEPWEVIRISKQKDSWTGSTVIQYLYGKKEYFPDGQGLRLRWRRRMFTGNIVVISRNTQSQMLGDKCLILTDTQNTFRHKMEFDDAGERDRMNQLLQAEVEQQYLEDKRLPPGEMQVKLSSLEITGSAIDIIAPWENLLMLKATHEETGDHTIMFAFATNAGGRRTSELIPRGGSVLITWDNRLKKEGGNMLILTSANTEETYRYVMGFEKPDEREKMCELIQSAIDDDKDTPSLSSTEVEYGSGNELSSNTSPMSSSTGTPSPPPTKRLKLASPAPAADEEQK